MEVRKELPEESTNEQDVETRKDRKKHQKYIWLLVGVLVVLLVIRTVVDFISGSKDSVISVYNEELDKSVVYANNKAIATIDDEAWIETNMNLSAYYVETEDTVYYLDGDELVEIMENAKIASLANKSKEALIWSFDGKLYCYDGSELELLTDKIVNFATISGDGKSYAYFSGGASYFGRESRKETKVKDTVIFKLSEDGSLRYGFQCYTSDYEELITEHELWFYAEQLATQLLLVQDNGETNVIAKEVDEIVALNETGTELVYVFMQETFLSLNGKAGTKLSEYTVDNFLYEENKKHYHDYFMPLESFKDSICIMDKGEMEYKCCHITKDYQTEEYFDGINIVLGCNESCSMLLYMDEDENLYRTTIRKDARIDKIAEDVSWATMSPDGKIIYYSKYTQDEEGMWVCELFCIKGYEKAKSAGIYEDVMNIYVLDKAAYIETGKKAYYLKEDSALELEGINHLEYDFIADKVYGYKEDVYQISGKSRKRLVEEFDLINRCYSAG